ncbi:putative carbonyl reductase [Xylariales sp. PMI_506]|nr:putative carbonyl reductase [Xylariales sp. PMI_506]
MSSYLVTGVSRGLGFEFVRQLSENPANTVFGFVRDKEATEQKVKTELPNRSNIHILQADVIDYEANQRAIEYISNVTGGSLDYVIANAAYQSQWSALDSFGDLGKKPAKLEEDLLEHFKVNTIGPIQLFNLITPLVLKGKAKKVIAISTGHADLDLINHEAVAIAGPYAISKAALNIAVAKFSAEYRDQGVLFMSISPGVVDTGNLTSDSEERQQKLFAMVMNFQKAYPNWTGPLTPEQSIKSVLSVIETATVETSAGTFVSHHGNKQWL